MLTVPPDGAIAVSRRPQFEWTAAAQATEYKIEIATDLGFTNIVEMAVRITETTYQSQTLLDISSTYYWRVLGKNQCGMGTYSEPFSFITRATLPLLLVDDDDNGPDVRSTYTDTLDALGQEYEVWDTNNSDNEPDATTLADYSTVIWFTGDEFGGAAGPGSAGEAALSSFLDGGGCLFISGQDYYYDRGLTSLMTDYLGVASASSDVDQTTVTGAGAVFGGMGPYTLQYPFSNYSDIVSPNASAELAFSGNAGNAAVAKETDIYHTTYWGFPFEAVPTTGDREALMSMFLDWCAPQVTDCNGNGIPDDEDIASGTSEDCNENAVPDECETNDCNENGVPDDCDIADSTSEDCNANAIPDECEPNDCNGNGVPDDCDIADSTSEDCNANAIPDECESNDCNENGIPDDCDIFGGTSVDCNENAVPDECDISSGSSQDSNENGVPDECDINTPLISMEGCRYIAVTADPPDSELPVAIAVQSPGYPCLDKYVAADGSVVDAPVYQNASAWGTALVHGPDVIPGTAYRFVSKIEGGPSTDAATVTTAAWGDTVGDFVNGQWTTPNGVIDFRDISATVDAFRNLPTAPLWWRCDLSPELPDGLIDFTDIGRVVDAFRALPYPFDVPCP